MNDPKRTHQLDQLTGCMAEQAQLAAAYFRELMAQGFSRDEALAMTHDMLHERWRSVFAVPPKDAA